MAKWSRNLSPEQQANLEELLDHWGLTLAQADPPPADIRQAVTFYLSQDTKAALDQLGRDCGLRSAGPMARLAVLGWLNHGPRPSRKTKIDKRKLM